MKPRSQIHRETIFNSLVGGKNVTIENIDAAASFLERLCREEGGPVLLSPFIESITSLGNAGDVAQFTKALFLSWPERCIEIFDAAMRFKPLPEGIKFQYLSGFVLGAMEMIDLLSQITEYAAVKEKLPAAFVGIIMKLDELTVDREFDPIISGRFRNAIPLLIRRVAIWELLLELRDRQANLGARRNTSHTAGVLIREVLFKVINYMEVGYMVDVFATGKGAVEERLAAAKK